MPSDESPVCDATRSQRTDSVLHLGDVLSPLAGMPLLAGNPLDHHESLQPDLTAAVDRLGDPGAPPVARGNPRQTCHERLRISSHGRSPLLWVCVGVRRQDEAGGTLRGAAELC